jgi:(4-alkanoyl-5-oxo-2,5-dihydrofuran-3-yl)methyl phosphate reductase
MVYLITGATGDVGSKVVEGLNNCGTRPRVFVRDPEKARSFFGNRVDIFVGDLADPASLCSALDGVDALFLVNSGPQIPKRDEAAAKAAMTAGVKHLVKLSSLDVQQGLAIGAWHEQGEAAISGSGIAFTFVQPSGFMSNLLAWARSVKTEAVVRSATGEGGRAFIHSEDIAAVSVKALTSGNYIGQALPITGPHALTFREVTAKIGAAIGNSLTFLPISDAEARERYSVISGSEEETAAHVELWRAIREGRVATVTGNVERVLGRKAIALDQWLMENAMAFR